MLKKLVFALFLAIPIFAFSQNTSIKLGFLDVQDLFQSLPETATIQATLKEMSDKHETEMKRMEDEFNRKFADYKQTPSMDETIKKNREEELQTLQTRMQNYYQKAQEELQKTQEDLQAPLKDKILKAIKDVGTENGFLYIFDSNGLLFKSDQAIDVTPLVKRKLGVVVK